MTYVWDKRTRESLYWRALEKVLHVLPSVCRYILSTCQNQVFEMDVLLHNQSFVSFWSCRSDCVNRAMSFFFCSVSSVWDDPSHACRLQRKSRHVQVAAATRSRCELQWTRAWIHSADVCWPVRYAVNLTGEILKLNLLWSSQKSD